MARIRTIKPEFWTDEAITECSLSARLLFIGMWNFADDRGNIERSAKQMKMKIFPADDIDCEPLLCELMLHNFLIEYEYDGKKYLHIRTFADHQIINRPSKTGLPEYEETMRTHAQLTEDSLTEGKGREGKGKEIKEGDKSPPLSPEKMMWDMGVKILTESGTPEKEARTFLGKHFRDNKIKLAEVISYIAVARPIDPKAYITKALLPEKPRLVM